MDIVVTTAGILSGHIHKRQESKKGLYLDLHITTRSIGNKGVYI